MGKKMKFPFLFRATEPTTTTSAASSWPWPACVNNPRTISFRATTPTSDNIYKTINSAYLDEKNTTATEFPDTPDSYFSIFDPSHEESLDLSPETCVSDQPGPDDSALILHGLRSDRLFFEPGETSSILEEAKAHDFPYKDTVEITAMDSDDPFLDFRISMEEMVEAHGLKDWDCLEELLTCYLRVNRKSNHGYIVGAFVDLLTHLSLVSTDSSAGGGAAVDENCSSSSTATQCSFTSPLSFSSSTYTSTSPCLSSHDNEDEIIVEKIAEISSSSSSCNASSSSPAV